MNANTRTTNQIQDLRGWGSECIAIAVVSLPVPQVALLPLPFTPILILILIILTIVIAIVIVCALETSSMTPITCPNHTHTP